MPGIIKLRLGDLFDGPADLIVLPCSRSGSITRFVAERLLEYAIPLPQKRMELGGIQFSPFTGWRIPLPGDPVGQPIQPGDTPREFEELDIVEWDPEMEPAEGDFRVRRGRPASVRVEFSCVPMSASGEWFSAGPWDVRQCEGVADQACREDFLDVGGGTRHPGRGCADSPEPVRFITWACRE